MHGNGQTAILIDLQHFEENRSKYPPEELLQYAGRFVAWSPEGTQILASGEDRETLKRQLQASGISSSQVVFDYIDPPDVAMLG